MWYFHVRGIYTFVMHKVANYARCLWQEICNERSTRALNLDFSGTSCLNLKRLTLARRPPKSNRCQTQLLQKISIQILRTFASVGSTVPTCARATCEWCWQNYEWLPLSQLISLFQHDATAMIVSVVIMLVSDNRQL